MGKIINRLNQVCYIFTQATFRVLITGLLTMKSICKSYKTCDGCPLSEEHTGCMFRNKIPREW